MPTTKNPAIFHEGILGNYMIHMDRSKLTLNNLAGITASPGEVIAHLGPLEVRIFPYDWTPLGALTARFKEPRV